VALPRRAVSLAREGSCHRIRLTKGGQGISLKSAAAFAERSIPAEEDNRMFDDHLRSESGNGVVNYSGPNLTPNEFGHRRLTSKVQQEDRQWP